MRLGGRLAAAIDILADIDARKRTVADALKDWGLSHRFAGSGDRAAIGNIVYDALRKRLSNAFLMDDDSPATLAHAVLFRQWGISPEELAGEIEGDRFAPAPPEADVIAALRERRLCDAPPHVQADVPEWTAASFEQALGEGWIAEMQAMAERPPLDLRVNTLKADREKVLKALKRSGAGPAAIAHTGIRIAAGRGPARLPNVTAEPSFAKGWFEVQDEGSQVVADLVMARAGEQVLDLCAGGGGKTLAMAASMENKGQIHAFDADRRRLAPIVERLRRAGTRNVQLVEERAGLEALTGRCDHVLVDAPCTGTGTWRRRPDTKWRLTPESLALRTGEQDAVLSDAASFVRPGGMLSYITCSLLPQENTARIEHFLADNDGFEPADAFDTWARVFPDSATKPIASGTGLLLTPMTSGTDGFFYAALRRKS